MTDSGAASLGQKAGASIIAPNRLSDWADPGVPPATSALPEVGRMRPASIRSVVVLPAR